MDDRNLNHIIPSHNGAPASIQLTDLSETISAYIDSCLPPINTPLAEPARHHFRKTGKQLRARMAIVAGDCFGVTREISLAWAASVELLHNASLIHDDICDGDTVRRGLPSIWAKYGKDTALALGDWMIATAFSQAAIAAEKSHTPQLVSILAQHMADTTLGQAQEFEIKSYPDWNDYMDISTGKTAPLFIAPVEGISRIARRHDVASPLSRFFTAAGGCYQIANDMLNVKGSDGAENPASDLLRRAPNAVIVMFRNTLDTPTREQFNRFLAQADNHDALSWQKRILPSSALEMTAKALMNMLEEAEISCAALPQDCQAIIAPIQAQLRSVCCRLTENL